MSTASEVKHTPGPWHVEPLDWDGRPELSESDVEYFSTIYGLTEKGNEFIIADLCGVGSGSYAQTQGMANARLIAAAPAMLEALEELVGKLEDVIDIGKPEILGPAWEVIALAKGEKP